MGGGEQGGRRARDGGKRGLRKAEMGCGGEVMQWREETEGQGGGLGSSGRRRRGEERQGVAVGQRLSTSQAPVSARSSVSSCCRVTAGSRAATCGSCGSRSASVALTRSSRGCEDSVEG